MKTDVIVQIASIPDRILLLKNTVESLIPQADEINVKLNGYAFTPNFLKDNDKITYQHFDNSRGDAVKFHGLEDKEGFIFTCDDDLIYPTDYVFTMIMKLLDYKNQVIVTNHGRIMNEKPVRSSFSDRVAAFHCCYEVLQDSFVDIGGTGVMAFFSKSFQPDFNKMIYPNMADIWIAKFAKEQNVKILVNAHEEGWITYQNPPWTIWDKEYPNPELQTQLYNSF